MNEIKKRLERELSHTMQRIRHMGGANLEELGGGRRAAPGFVSYGKIAKARAGKPNPFSTFGQVTTMTAPVGGTLSRFAITSI